MQHCKATILKEKWVYKEKEDTEGLLYSGGPCRVLLNFNQNPVDWLCCVWVSRPKVILVTVHFPISLTCTCSVAKLCPIRLQHARLPVLHYLPEFAQIHVHWVSDAIQPPHPPLSLVLPPVFPASGSFPMNQFFASGSQSIGASASVSVLPMNIQDWSPLGWTGWISLLSKGLSRVFSNTTVQKHQFFSTRLSL